MTINDYEEKQAAKVDLFMWAKNWANDDSNEHFAYMLEEAAKRFARAAWKCKG
jgi:hypothetical protein